MKKAFVDTTILVDLLLKSGQQNVRAKAALKQFDTAELPVYAIKELSAGPLQYFAWLHNKFVVLGSYAETIDALQRMSGSPKRYLTSTAIQVLVEAAKNPSNSAITSRELVEEYGPEADLDKMLKDRYRLSIKTMVYKAWSKRRKVTDAVVEELSCYIEEPPTEENGLIHINSAKCKSKCAVASRLRDYPGELAKLVEILKPEHGREGSKRYQALRHIKRKPHDHVSEDQCRSFGDAVFAILAPVDSTILTTNRKDYEPLVSAIGKNLMVP
ncbi:MAG: hypothetical protein HY730_08025 [Candidatus Tectomicrobia bacterium]|uniref:PIN domain-containing protein n=1 Tax=Tectimicrobiota bacterium TaxID=2528274 RepID=A0A933GND7_UNCTE|nr:hypothetical protein [Candidatus Tectomicrobia bacterium]